MELFEEVKNYRQFFIDQAERGDAESQFILAEKYFYGDEEYFEEDDDSAFYWYEKSATQGHVKAECMLGVCYCKGYGVEQNQDKAVEYFTKAANNGDDDAMVHLAHILFLDNWKDSLDNATKAIEYLESACKELNYDAIYALAVCYIKGAGVEKNIDKAIELFEELDFHEEPFGAFELAKLYEQGELVERNLELALHWYKRSAELGLKYSKELEHIKDDIKNTKYVVFKTSNSN